MSKYDLARAYQAMSNSHIILENISLCLQKKKEYYYDKMFSILSIKSEKRIAMWLDLGNIRQWL